jgi:hypothetical protein
VLEKKKARTIEERQDRMEVIVEVLISLMR